MPNLPTLTVTQDQADRMLAAFAPFAGATQADTIASYKEWLRQSIVNRVIEYEVQQVRIAVTDAEKNKKAEVVSALPPPPAPTTPVSAPLPTP